MHQQFEEEHEMEHILAILNREHTGAAVLRVARMIAGRLGQAQIAVLHPRLAQDPSFMPTEEVMTKERQTDFDRLCAKRAEALRDLYEHWHASLAAEISARWIEIIGDPVRAIASEATRAELIVVGHALPDDLPDAHVALKTSLYDADAPVVIAPVTPPSAVGSRPAVAWKKSDAVEKAISAALPILLAADDVTILIAGGDGPEGGDEPASLLRTMEQANIPCHVVRFGLHGREIGEALLEEAKAHQADLLVMGGYTRSRFTEMLLGGATREMLAKADIPLLMHH
jgi:nucleotide-binding universal stress UspA family protein